MAVCFSIINSIKLAKPKNKLIVKILKIIPILIALLSAFSFLFLILSLLLLLLMVELLLVFFEADEVVVEDKLDVVA
jgi:hypothetical protein